MIKMKTFKTVKMNKMLLVNKCLNTLINNDEFVSLKPIFNILKTTKI